MHATEEKKKKKKKEKKKQTQNSWIQPTLSLGSLLDRKLKLDQIIQKWNGYIAMTASVYADSSPSMFSWNIYLYK